MHLLICKVYIGDPDKIFVFSFCDFFHLDHDYTFFLMLIIIVIIICVT
jgi:hypothetical protein